MDPYGDEDVEMAAAIAASLEMFKDKDVNRNQNIEPIEIDDDSADEENEDDKFQADLERALKASAQEVQSNGASTSNDVANATLQRDIPVDDEQAKKAALASDFLRQRAQLEKERLKRNQRLAQNIGRPVSATTAAGKKRSYSESQSDSDDDDDDQQSKRKPLASSGSSRATTKANTSISSSTSADEGELFYEHEMRPTVNIHTVDNDKENKRKLFRLMDLIGDKEKVAFAILSSYCNMETWLYQLFAPQTPVILVSQPYQDGNADVKATFPNWIKTMPMLRGGRGAMHVKLMMLFYQSGRLRVVLPTANFVDYDWAEIENAAWVQDFPPLSRTPLGKDATALAFSSTLTNVLTKLNVPAALGSTLKDHPNLPLPSVDSLGKRWDFSKVKVRLIPSMAGRYEGWDQVIRQGHVGLMKGVIDIGAHADHSKRKNKPLQLQLECQGSSIGQYTTQWLNEIYSSASGISPEKWLVKSRQTRSQAPFPPVKILFPSLLTVNRSVLGQAGAGTMFCRQTYWNGANFPRELFHDSNSKRGGVLMHTKMILGLWKPKTAKPNTLAAFTTTANGKKIPSGVGRKDAPIELDSSDDEDDDDVQLVEPNAAGWLYVGSHNFTPSAWGTVSGTSFTPILNITNYELGVLIPLSADPVEAEGQGTEMASWVRPARKYNLATGGDLPWCQN